MDSVKEPVKLDPIHTSKAKYHKTKEPALVYSEAEEKALGEGWQDTPFAAVDETEAESDPAKPTKAELKAAAKAAALEAK